MFDRSLRSRRETAVTAIEDLALAYGVHEQPRSTDLVDAIKYVLAKLQHVG